jgi:hypothetical protein
VLNKGKRVATVRLRKVPFVLSETQTGRSSAGCVRGDPPTLLGLKSTAEGGYGGRIESVPYTIARSDDRVGILGTQLPGAAVRLF